MVIDPQAGATPLTIHVQTRRGAAPRWFEFSPARAPRGVRRRLRAKAGYDPGPTSTVLNLARRPLDRRRPRGTVVAASPCSARGGRGRRVPAMTGAARHAASRQRRRRRAVPVIGHAGRRPTSCSRRAAPAPRTSGRGWRSSHLVDDASRRVLRVHDLVLESAVARPIAALRRRRGRSGVRLHRSLPGRIGIRSGRSKCERVVGPVFAGTGLPAPRLSGRAKSQWASSQGRRGLRRRGPGCGRRLS